MATPQFDPTDKRLPGIMHSFFAQVRACSDSASPKNPNHQRAFAIPVASEERSHTAGEAEVSSDSRSLSGSIVFLERDQISDSAPSEQNSDPAGNEGPLELADPKSLPTPPHSSSSSIVQRDLEEAENGAPLVEKGVGSVYRALKSFILPKNSSKRRHTSSPVSSVSNDAVLASHFSNPSLPASQPQPLPACPESSQSISKSSEELAKLTDNAAVGPRPKNTPPLTPRAMSNETQHTDKRSAHSLGSSPARSRPESTRSNGQTSTRTSSTNDDQGPQVPVGPIKGKLNVRISEGRGLRPSYDPYLVCVFEWNEYISKGAQEAAHKKSRLDAVGSVPIQRSNSDSGRPVAIPMRSRQSSQNSLMDSDRRRSDQVTDPQWNHDAVLCVAFHPP